MTYINNENIQNSIKALQHELEEDQAKLNDLKVIDPHSQIDDGYSLDMQMRGLADDIKDLQQQLDFQQGLEVITIANGDFSLYASHTDKKFYIYKLDNYYCVSFGISEAKHLCEQQNFVSALEPGATDRYKNEYNKLDDFGKLIETFKTKANRDRLDDEILERLMDRWQDRGSFLELEEEDN